MKEEVKEVKAECKEEVTDNSAFTSFDENGKPVFNKDDKPVFTSFDYSAVCPTDGVSVVEGTVNQYSLGAPSSCSVCALEAALRLLNAADVSPDTVDLSVRAGSQYSAVEHLSPGELISDVPRYRDGLTISAERFSLDVAGELEASFDKLARGSGETRVCVIVKPPETLMLARLADGRFVLFDSHSRPDHREAAFLCFAQRPAAERYLGRLCEGLDGDARDAAEVNPYNMVEVYWLARGASLLDALPEGGPLQCGQLMLREQHQLQRQEDDVSSDRKLAEASGVQETLEPSQALQLDADKEFAESSQANEETLKGMAA
eukprot:Selendium_serpulae@DN5917_c5_g1_i7.p1